MAALACILWQCSSEDFNFAENNPKRNNSDFFKHSSSGGLANRGEVDYVSILEDYNDEHNFLASMPDQEGMPIWEKIQVLNVDNYTALYIPLSKNGTNLSSVMLVSIDENNEVSALRDYTNDYLYNYVYDVKYSKEMRKFLMDTFLYMDFIAFQSQRFINLPTDLYEGVESGNRMNILNVQQQTLNNGKFLYQTVCITFHACANNCSLSSCDYRNCQHGGKCYVVESCSTTSSWEDDPTGNSFPGHNTPGNGGGGVGTGTGPAPTNPGPQPPRDPCAYATVFYRLMPTCASTGTGDDGDFFDNPCTTAKPSIDNANQILHTTVGQSMDSFLKGKAQAPNEWAISLDQKPDGTYETSTPNEGTPYSSSSPNALPPNITVGDGHSHAGNSGKPSGGDLYIMLELLLTNPNFKYRYVYGDYFGSPETYALVVNDASASQAFLNQFPKSENYDAQTHMIKRNSNLGRDFYKAAGYYYQGAAENISNEIYDANAVGMAYVLDKYHAGISISKVDANGNLKKILANVETITIPLSGGAVAEGVKVKKCP